MPQKSLFFPIALVLWALYEFSGISNERTFVIAAIVAASALVASIAGFAFSALAGSAFAYLGLAPAQAVQTMVVCSIAIQLYAVWKIRASIHWFGLWPMGKQQPNAFTAFSWARRWSGLTNRFPA